MALIVRIEFNSLIDISKWDAVEVHPVWEDELGNGDVVDEGQETYWGVYVHLVDGGIQCIAEMPTKELANDLEELIEKLAKTFVDNKYF